MVQLDTCYRMLDVYSWSFAVLGAVALTFIGAVNPSRILSFPVYWIALAAVLLQWVAAIVRGLPFLLRYGVFAATLMTFVVCSVVTLGITPNWCFFVIMLLSSAGLLFGTQVGLLASAAVCVIHVVIGWAWVKGYLPAGGFPPAAASAYTDFRLAGVWARVLIISIGLLVALQLLIRCVLGDMNRALNQAESTLGSLTAEQERRVQTEQKFQAIFNNSPDICAVTSLRDGRLIDVNRAFETLTGWKWTEAIGRTTPELGFWDSVEERNRVVRLLAETGEVTGLETAWNFRSGERRVGIMSMRRMVVGGEPVLNVVIRDITDIRQAQERHCVLERQLNRVQKMEGIGVLAGGIAHDFNNILTGILGFAEIARLSPGDPVATAEALDEIRKAGLRAKDLVAEILTFSRQSDAALVPLELSTVVGETVKFLRASTPATVKIERRLAAGRVRADPVQLHQVVLNLTTNAIQAMGDRAGTLAVTVERVELDEARAAGLSNVTPGPFMRLTIADTGPGMDPAMIGRIFEPFFTTKPIGQGTGLGLAIVRSVVAAHRGAITVESAVGRGTTFHVLLPVCETLASDATAPVPVPPGRGERVLLVDDELSVGQFARVRLEQMGYRVTVFDDPQRALAAVRAAPAAFDVIVSDFAMPGLNGFELVRRVHAHCADLPAVILTGNRAIFPSDDRGTQPNHITVVDKPFSGDDLVRALQRVLPPAPAPSHG